MEDLLAQARAVGCNTTPSSFRRKSRNKGFVSQFGRAIVLCTARNQEVVEQQHWKSILSAPGFHPLAYTRSPCHSDILQNNTPTELTLVLVRNAS